MREVILASWKFLGEEAWKQKRLGVKEDWELILDNMTEEEEQEWTLEEGELDRDKRKDGHRPVRGSTEGPMENRRERDKKGKRRSGNKRKKRSRRGYICNIQTETGPLKDQYITTGKGDQEEDRENRGRRGG